jgi:hypothetical protein
VEHTCTESVFRILIEKKSNVSVDNLLLLANCVQKKTPNKDKLLQREEKEKQKAFEKV